ncbi:hypothetical protein MOKP104_09910 [Mycobacterium avium subsp. hominissuis]
MRLLGVPGAQQQPGPAVHPSGALARRDRLPPADQVRPEVLAHHRHHLVVVDVAGHRHHHPFRCVAADVKRVQLRPRHRRDRPRGADDRPAHRVVAEQRAQEHVPQRVLGVVVAHRDLFQHHVALEFDVLGGAAAVEHHVRDQVDGQFQVGVQHVRVVAGVFLGGERVQFSPDGVHRLRDVHRGAGGRGLEQQVLEEVRGAGHGGTLVAGADADPHPDRGGPHRGQVLGDHPQAAGQRAAPQGGVRVRLRLDDLAGAQGAGR